MISAERRRNPSSIHGRRGGRGGKAAFEGKKRGKRGGKEAKGRWCRKGFLVL